jgi:hypothetical protein
MYMWSNGEDRAVAASVGDLVKVLVETYGEEDGMLAWKEGLGWRQMSPYERVTLREGGEQVTKTVVNWLETEKRGIFSSANV